MVPVYKRSHTDMEILTKCDELCSEVVRVVKTEKIIPKRYEKLIGYELFNDVRRLAKSISAANSMNLFDEVQRRERRRLQLEAVILISDVKMDIKLGMKTAEVTVRAYQNCVTAIGSVEAMLRNWMKNDDERVAKKAEETART